LRYTTHRKTTFGLDYECQLSYAGWTAWRVLARARIYRPTPYPVDTATIGAIEGAILGTATFGQPARGARSN
jgi:hypothetical protein